LPSNPRPTTRAAAPDRIFVDSGGWFAFFSRRDRHHEEADAFFRGAAAQRTRLVTTVVVLAEVHRLLLFRAGIRAAAAALTRIEANPLVALEFVNGDHHRAARHWLERLADQPITYADAVSFAIMEAVHCRIALAFDHHFEVAGFTRWRRPP
jgi:predicted nucleic acid-binding protein